MTRKIKLITIEDIKEFTNVASRYGDMLTIKADRYIVPACSLMSVISLNLSEPVKLCFDDEYVNAIALDFKKWIVE